MVPTSGVTSDGYNVAGTTLTTAHTLTNLVTANNPQGRCCHRLHTSHLATQPADWVRLALESMGLATALYCLGGTPASASEC